MKGALDVGPKVVARSTGDDQPEPRKGPGESTGTFAQGRGGPGAQVKCPPGSKRMRNEKGCLEEALGRSPKVVALSTREGRRSSMHVKFRSGSERGRKEREGAWRKHWDSSPTTDAALQAATNQSRQERWPAVLATTNQSRSGAALKILEISHKRLFELTRPLAWSVNMLLERQAQLLDQLKVGGERAYNVGEVSPRSGMDSDLVAFRRG